MHHSLANFCSNWALLSLVLMVADATFIAPALADNSPSTRTSMSEDARLRRGIQVRKILLSALNWADRHNGEWPAELPSGSEMKLGYAKPGKSNILTWTDAARAEATVVLHESIAENPAGVWVGYADGHLEFAASAEQLAACKDLLRIVQAMPGGPEKEPAKPPGEKAEGELKLQVVDSEGKPVLGALIGAQAHFLDTPPAPDDPRVNFFGEERDGPATTDHEGIVNLTATRVFGNSSGSARPVDLYVLQEPEGLVALDQLQPAEFGKGLMRQIRLGPGCEVTGKITSVALYETGRKLSNVSVFVSRNPGPPQGFIACESIHGEFRCLLPPGAYRISAQGNIPTGRTYPTWRYVQVKPGQRRLDLQLDVQPHATAMLPGQSAPELRSIKGWKNGQPIKLTDLKGKVVLVDFWGYWCGVCNTEMPDLMKLHDEFKDKGLVIVAIHDDSAESIEDMDHKLEEVRNKLWNGRDLPFLIALDGGGLTRITGSSTWARGATTAAYGVDAFPTTFLIGTDGIIIQKVRRETIRTEIEKLLNAKEREGN